MSSIFRQIVTVYKNIIQIYHAYIIHDFSQRFIDINLKDCKYVNKFKKYYLIFKMFVARAKSYFSFVIMLDANSVINILEIEFNKSFKII